MMTNFNLILHDFCFILSTLIVFTKDDSCEFQKNILSGNCDVFHSQVEKWFGKKKQIAAVRTVCSHINNMFKGVTLVSG